MLQKVNRTVKFSLAIKKMKSICFHCKKSLIIPMSCVCGNVFCIEHRHREIHKCDPSLYSSKEKEQLARALVKVDGGHNHVKI